KELNETGVWLRIIRRSEMLPSARVAPIEQECDELCKIISTNIKTALSNSPDNKSRRARASTSDG
ncbi:MAG: four helix bundle protein, partial [Bacteroidetes bacterium]|nr:four helix bundle protein [Bacteroidota bacterium]